MAACQAAVSSKEFIEWVAFDEFEPIGTRTTPELLALLISVQANAWKGKGDRPVLPQDVLPNPMAPRRLSAKEEGARTRKVAGTYRRLRAERLAKAEGLAKMDASNQEQVH